VGRKLRPNANLCVWCSVPTGSRKQPPICDDCERKEQQRDEAARDRSETTQATERRGRG
jgi:hypothetical protein